MRIEGTNVSIDAFANEGAALISHYHQDHMRGLARFKRPPRGGQASSATVYCSDVTARLLAHLDAIAPERLSVVKPGEMFEPEPRLIVTALDANHCPGSLMFFIEHRGRRILYTGDFRLNDDLRRTCAAFGGVDSLYLDTTYDRPHYRFPSREEAVRRIIALIKRNCERKSAICVATYTIGKEMVLQAIHAEFGEPFYVTDTKHEVCVAMGLGALVTRDKKATRFRAYARGYLEQYFKMSREYRSGESMVIIPTGWAMDSGRNDPHCHYVPYSEHCDYAELTEFKALVGAREVMSLQGKSDRNSHA